MNAMTPYQADISKGEPIPAPSPVAPAPLWENLEGCQCIRCGQSHHHFHDTGWKISTPPEAPKDGKGLTDQQKDDNLLDNLNFFGIGF